MRALPAALAALACAAAAGSVRADAVPDLPEPRCERGFVVGMTHDGPECMRPSCRVDADCPGDLRCTPRRCWERTYDEACVERQHEGAKGPPDPCEGYVLGALCDDAERTCPEPAHCPLGTCLPADELASGEASPAGSGGGCCGSRGARASLVTPFALALAAALGTRRPGARRRRAR